MRTRSLGAVEVGAIGLGAMPLSISGRGDETAAVATIHAALDAGVTLIDTADAYCLDAADIGHNERLVAKAVRAWRGDCDAVIVATKGGHVRTADGAWLLDGSHADLRGACEASLRALGVDAIDLYQHHRPDPAVPYAESIGALAELRAEGKIRMVGISNANTRRIEEARAIVDVVSVQNEFSPASVRRNPSSVSATSSGSRFLPWSPLGAWDAGRLGGTHRAFQAVADERGVSPQQVCLAWHLAKSPIVIPIPGSSRTETILDSAAAADLDLTPEEVARLDA